MRRAVVGQVGARHKSIPKFTTLEQVQEYFFPNDQAGKRFLPPEERGTQAADRIICKLHALMDVPQEKRK